MSGAFQNNNYKPSAAAKSVLVLLNVGTPSVTVTTKSAFVYFVLLNLIPVISTDAAAKALSILQLAVIVAPVLAKVTVPVANLSAVATVSSVA